MKTWLPILLLLPACDPRSWAVAQARDGAPEPRTPAADQADIEQQEPQPLSPAERCARKDAISLPGPSLEEWKRRPAALRLGPLKPTQNDDDTTSSVVANWYNARIHLTAEENAVVIGYARRGNRIPVARWVGGAGCPGQQWYAIEGGGYVCASMDFRPSKGLHIDADGVHSQVWEPLPYEYAKVTHQGAPLLDELPSAADAERLALAAQGKAGWPSQVESILTGAYFITIHEPVLHEGYNYYQTESEDYVRAEDVELLPVPRLTGIHLDEERGQLPVGFVHAETAPVFCQCDGDLRRCGTAAKHARLAVDQVSEIEGRKLVRLRDGTLLEREHVRLVQRVERPEDVDGSERWVHIDRGEQTLTAYEGDEPVFATLVSTGKPGFETPRGLYRIDRKFLTTTMTGKDDVHGTYTVSEVPWTMYYDGPYAVHGTYWHQGFGNTRSHGCTNVAAADARWLYYWTSPELPAGWHGKAGLEGTWVHISG